MADTKSYENRIQNNIYSKILDSEQPYDYKYKPQESN